MGRYDISRSWLDRGKKVLACSGAQTLSKSWTRHPDKYPKYIDRGEGSKVWDIDSNCYIDYTSALGPILLGYNHPAVVNAVIEQVHRGPLFSLEHPLSVEVAEMLVEMVPGADKIRFAKTGSIAVESAVRVARTYTGREIVLVAKSSYHGMSEWFQVRESLGAGGVPKCLKDRIRDFNYNDTTSLEEAFRQSPEPVAAVILEPARDFMASFSFLQAARRLCDEHGALLILDEVVTAFRFPGYTYATWSGVTPDLLCLGKAMASGYPLGAVAGRTDVMDAFDRCFVSGTYHGEAVSLAATKATLTILRDEPVVEHVWRQGHTLMAGFTAAMERYDVPGTADGIPPCWRQNFHGPHAAELKMAFMSACAERGILPGLITYVSYSHSDDDVQRTIEVYHKVADVLAEFLKNA